MVLGHEYTISMGHPYTRIEGHGVMIQIGTTTFRNLCHIYSTQRPQMDQADVIRSVAARLIQDAGGKV